MVRQRVCIKCGYVARTDSNYCRDCWRTLRAQLRRNSESDDVGLAFALVVAVALALLFWWLP